MSHVCVRVCVLDVSGGTSTHKTLRLEHSDVNSEARNRKQILIFGVEDAVREPGEISTPSPASRVTGPHCGIALYSIPTKQKSREVRPI